MNENTTIAPGTFRTLGKKVNSRPKSNTSRIRLFAVPKVSNKPVNVYARIYGGTAKGSIKAHSKIFFPVKL